MTAVAAERGAGRDSLAAEVTARFGMLPNFFVPAPGAEGLLDGLWAFAKAAYLDSPLPSLFKERLFVHLSRFCEVRYCVIRHACFLGGLARPAGDPDAPAHTVEEIAALLGRPAPERSALEAALRRLEDSTVPAPVPRPGTEREADLLDALTVIFLDTWPAARARAAVLAATGNPVAEHLFALVAFVRAAHHWTELHPGLPLEPDAIEFLGRNPELARRLTDPAEAVAVTVEAPAELAVTTNPGLLERIVSNLAENAAKYTAAAQITLRAAAAVGGVTVEVRDTGQGLGLPAAEAIERFSRGGARGANGFGLGLSIAHQAASALSATLSLRDNPGGGTIARLCLPQGPPAPARILVIEDEHAIRDAVSYTLQAAGYQVTEAASGQDGLAGARRERFDLVIVDLLLPDMPGADVIRRLRADGSGAGLRVLAITAHAGTGVRDLALSAGADQFMTKPFAMERLLQRTRALTSDRAV